MDTDKIFNLDDDQLMPLPGSLLVAKPTVNDPIFGRSVILMVEHNDEGSMGLIINNHIGWALNHQVEGLKSQRDVLVYLGGPVGLDQLFFIHTLGEELIPQAISLGNGLYLGGDFEAMMEHLRACESVDKLSSQVKFCLGYSGWSSGQLKQEIARHDWAVLDALPPSVILSENYHELWNKAVAQFGDRYRLWLNWPSDPSFN